MENLLNILIIDDDDVDRMTVKRALKKAGISADFKEAGDGGNGLKLLRENSFSCVFLDYLLPDKDGLAVLQSARCFDPLTPIIMLTGHGDERLAVTLMQAGASDYVPKSEISPEHLSQALTRATRLYQAEMERRRAEDELQKAYKELKATQMQMLQREKMASIGQLAAGVAHEINNPLGFITSNLNTLHSYLEKINKFLELQTYTLKDLADAIATDNITAERKKLKLDYVLEDSQDLIEESLEGTERVKKIVQNLKTFSRVDEAEIQCSDINQCLESTINIAWNEIKYKATLNREFSEIPDINCNPQQLNQVFLNLLINASHAIEDKGEITVKSWSDDTAVHVSITDTGKGIPPENLSNIFEPFFTTKEVGKGTGLGLSISYDIVKKHQGEILVESEIGQGTTFTVKLPISS